MGLDLLVHNADEYVNGRQHDPYYQFTEGRKSHESGQPTIVNMTSTSDIFKGGHAVLATSYETDQDCQPPFPPLNKCYVIRVLNPNYPSAEVARRPTDQQFIQLWKNQGGQWQYSYQDHTTVYAGDESARSGRLYITPFRFVREQPKTPLTTWDSIAKAGTFVWVGDAGTLVQASDSQGRTLYAGSGHSGRPQWTELSATPMELAPIPATEAGEQPYELYAAGHIMGRTHVYEFAPAPDATNGTPYEAAVYTGRQASTFVIPGTTGKRDKQLISANSASLDEDPYVSSDGLTLLFASTRGTGGDRRLHTASISGTTYGTPVEMPGIYAGDSDYRPVLGPERLKLYYASRRAGFDGDSDGDIWLATRSTTTGTFANPVNQGVLNTGGSEHPVFASADGCSLYYASNREHGGASAEAFEIYEARRTATPALVTIQLNITGGVGSVGAPFSCANNSSNVNSGVCSYTAPFGNPLVVVANRQATWSGQCAPHGATSSSDAYVWLTTGGTCHVTFPTP